MPNLTTWSMRRAAGLLLILSSIANFAGVWMYNQRNGAAGLPPIPGFFIYERSLIVAAVVLTALGFAVLEGEFAESRGRVLARIGATAYLFAGVLLATAEALNLTLGSEAVRGLGVIYAVMAFLAQASIGGALLRSRMVATWIASITILWNMAWLIVLPLVSPSDIYFPVLHHLMPLIIGIALLRKPPSKNLPVE
jgi:hypothetical protein